MVRVFAVEPAAVQLDWPSLPPGPHRLSARGDDGVVAEAAVAGDGGPGAVLLDGLTSGATVDIELDGRRVARATTLEPPPGRLLGRLATIGDLHLGETRFGVLPRVVSTSNPAVAHPVVCTSAAINELLAWGAQFVVVKGDLAHSNRAFEYELAAELLADLPVPTMVLPGNHDGGNHHRTDARTELARHGVTLIDGVAVHDLPGLRVIGADTRTSGQAGTVAAIADDVIEAAAGADGATLVALHHNLMTSPVATHPPPGVPAAESRRFLDALAAAQPAAVVTSGHTHRHRVRHHGPLLVTEVGSPKDYPGTWAGYLVYEGGIVQVVRRVMAPEAIRWTERTARMFGGAWGRWSPGRLGDRCISHQWPRQEAITADRRVRLRRS